MIALHCLVFFMFFEQETIQLHFHISVCASGVNVVLNSLAEEKLLASVRCLARHGRFLEIGKFDLANNSPLGE